MKPRMKKNGNLKAKLFAQLKSQDKKIDTKLGEKD